MNSVEKQHVIKSSFSNSKAEMPLPFPALWTPLMHVDVAENVDRLLHSGLEGM